MKEYPLTIKTIPSSTCYPSTVQKLLQAITDFAFVSIDDILQPYSISDTSPSLSLSQNPWAQTSTSLSGYGSPKTIRLYINGQWREFSQFSQGDAVLVPSYTQIAAPWGVYGQTYTFGDTGLPNYTPTFNPNAPEGYKYKIYVGYYV